MKNEFDDKYIANEVKKYSDNIQVPEELGGMIMKKVNNENESSNKIKSGKKVKKIVAIAASLVIVFGVGTFAAIKCNLFSKESQTINNIEQSQMATGKEEKIDNNVVNIDNIVGEWKPYKAVDKNNKEVSLKVVYGSSYKAETDALKIKEDGTYTYYMGASMGDGSEEGTYTIINNESFKLVSKTGEAIIINLVNENNDLKLVDNGSERVGEYSVYFTKETKKDNNKENNSKDNNVVNIDNIVGEWKPYKAVDKNNKEVSLKVVYGSSYKAETDALKIKEDGTYTYYMGASMGDGSEEGTYTIINNESFKLVSKTGEAIIINLVNENNDLKLVDNGSERVGEYSVYFTKETKKDNNKENNSKDNNVVNIDNIVGEWKPYKAVDKNNKEVSLKVVYGSSYKAETDALKIKEDGTYTYYMGASMGDGSEEGTYTIINNESFKLVSKTGEAIIINLLNENNDLKLVDNGSERVGEYTVYFTLKK